MRENGATSGFGVLASYTYDPLYRRNTIACSNAASSTLAYDRACWLLSLSQNLAGTTYDVNFGLGNTAAGQLSSHSHANALYN